MKLQDIVKEIERMGKMYRDSKNPEARKSYDQYIELIILNEAEQPQQYNLNDYWTRLIR